MKEIQFIRELRNDLREDDVLLYRIADFPTSYIQQRNGLDGNIRFNPPKLVDLIGAAAALPGENHGMPIFIEAKMIKGFNSFPIKNIRDEQLKMLLELENRAFSRIVINYRIKEPNPKRAAKLEAEHLVERNRVCALTSCLASDILRLRNLGYKSIPISHLVRSMRIRPWGGRWTLDNLRGALWEPEWSNLPSKI